MKIGQSIKEKQPELYKKLHKKHKRKRDKEHLSFSDFQNIMKHDSYCRSKGGAIRQVRHGK